MSQDLKLDISQINGYVDAHIHVDHYPEGEQEELLRTAFASGITAIVAVSMHLASAVHNRMLSAQFPGRIMPAYGYHPEQPQPSEEEVDELLGWMVSRIQAGESFAVGEVGLPYYTRTEAESNGEAFDESGYVRLLEQFVAFAAEYDRPIVLHAVYEDADKALDLLEAYRVRRAHFHWFKGAAATVERMIEQRCYISITPDVLYEEEIQLLVLRYPLELIMTETDGPWPFEGPFEGQKTVPGMVAQVAEAIARLKGVDVEQAKTQLYRNAVQFYDLK